MVMGARDDPRIIVHGSVDDVRVYNRALSAVEINSLYSSTLR
jgi:hypothetical protein